MYRLKSGGLDFFDQLRKHGRVLAAVSLLSFLVGPGPVKNSPWIGAPRPHVAMNVNPWLAVNFTFWLMA